MTYGQGDFAAASLGVSLHARKSPIRRLQPADRDDGPLGRRMHVPFAHCHGMMPCQSLDQKRDSAPDSPKRVQNVYLRECKTNSAGRPSARRTLACSWAALVLRIGLPSPSERT